MSSLSLQIIICNLKNRLVLLCELCAFVVQIVLCFSVLGYDKVAYDMGWQGELDEATEHLTTQVIGAVDEL